MNPIGSAGLALPGPPVQGGGGHQMMVNTSNSFDSSAVALSVSLAGINSLCNILTELKLPTPVVDKSAHTRTLVAGGLCASNRPPVLSDLSLVPQLQQALYLAKAKTSEISFISNPAASNYCQTPIVSPSSADPTIAPTPAPQAPPSRLLVALSSQDTFFNSTSPSSIYSPLQPQPPPQQQQQHQHSHTPQHAHTPQHQHQHQPQHQPLHNGTSAGNILANNLHELNADLQTIEPSIDRHMTDFDPNLVNDLINDDCDMSSLIHNNSSNNNSNNHDLRTDQFDANYSSLGERVKSRQREAAARANLATSNNLQQPNSHTLPHFQQPNSFVSNQKQPNNGSNNGDVSISNHKQPVRSESIASDEDRDWQLPNQNKRQKSDSYSTTPSTVRRQSSTPAPPVPRRTYNDVKPQQIKSVKYSFDADYSDSMLLNSSVDIVVRFEQIIDEILSTSCNDFQDYDDDDDTDDDADDDYYSGQRRSSKKKRRHAKGSNHVNGMSFDVSISQEQLKEIMVLSAKLKQSNRAAEVERKKVILFLTALSNQLNIWLTRYKSKAAFQGHEEDQEEAEERELYWELCCNASQSALHIMTSSTPNNDKASLISLEELIEVIVDFLSHNLSSTTHVSSSAGANSRSPKAKSHAASHYGVSKRQVTRWTQLLQLLFEFINLRSKGSLTDTLILSLTRISMSALFLLQNTSEMQFVSIEIMCHVFEEYQSHRRSILEELINSLQKIPTKKSHRKDSVLTQLLVRLTNAFFQPDAILKSSTNTLQTREALNAANLTATQVISSFLNPFVRKCTHSTGSSEVDFKLIFEALLNDLLESLHSPHSTSCILIVQIIAKLLMSHLSPNQQKNSSLSSRNFAIEYLSIICSKFAQFIADKEDTAKELAKTLSTIEESEKAATVTPSKRSKKDKKKDKEKVKVKEEEEEQETKDSPQVIVDKVWNMLVDYFNAEKLHREKLVLTSVWLKDPFFGDEQREAKLLQRLAKSTSEDVSVIDISTAALCIQYMEFVQLSTNLRVFEYAIKMVTASLSNTTNTTQRSKAMKCLSNILNSSGVERANQLLARSDLQGAMQSALLDPSTSVREATVDLIGRFVLQSKDQALCQRYCNLIGERILDTGISVRKRVIKILRDFCIEFPEFEKCGEIAAKIVRRINDDGEGIRRLVVDTCRDLWFSTTSAPSKFKVYSLLHVIATMFNEQSNVESMQSLFDQLIKPDTMPIAQDICDCIMTDILIDDLPQMPKSTQLSAIQCVAMMSQCCPQLMVKHCDTLQSFLSLSCETIMEITVRTKVIQTLERILPHITNPSPHLLTRIEEDLTKNILQSAANIIQCSVKCLSILIKNHTKNTKLAVDLFVKHQQILYQYKTLLYEGQKEEAVKPKLLRAIFTCGLFAKYFSNDIFEHKVQVRDTFIELILSPYNVDIKCKSIVALGFLIESEPKICLLPKVVDIYTSILQNRFASDGNPVVKKKQDEMFCIQVLNNFRNYLSESIESDENAVKTIEWSRESLKSMQSLEDDSCSASQIIQTYLSSVLINALNPNLAIRRVACNVIHVIHSGGHVHPLQLVSHLVAMTSDDDQQIRMRADHVLHEIERKYHGFVGMKAKEAIYLSAIFCKRLAIPGYRIYLEKNAAASGEDGSSTGAPVVTKEICARLTTLYKVICNNRQSRRAFVTSLLRNLDITDFKQPPTNQGGADFASNSSSTVAETREMIELEFVVENILFFPYTVYDEVLYILTQLECTSSLNATHITQFFKDIFIIEKLAADPSQNNHHHQQQYQMDEHGNYIADSSNLPYSQNVVQDQLEEIDFDNEEHRKKYDIRVNFELLLTDSNNERLNNLVRSLRAIYLSTLLRTLLKDFYLLKDDKIKDYSTSDAKTWEKPVHRRQVRVTSRFHVQ